MKIRGLEYHIEEYGAKTNPPLLMLHGFTGNTTNWHPFISQLEKDYRLILVDFPGHGQTEITENPEDYNFSF
ncbi:MAG: alpha/beta fold hydrolase, partial [Aggregatilineales bacterium]